MDIHSGTRSSSFFYILLDRRAGGQSTAVGDAPEASLCPQVAYGRSTFVLEATADAILATAVGLNPRTEDFQRAVPRFKEAFARLVPDYTAQDMLTALSLYLGERERQLGLLAILDRLAGRTGAEFLPRGTIRLIVEQAAKAGDAGAVELLSSPRPPACLGP
jgi:hypothetical protein